MNGFSNRQTRLFLAAALAAGVAAPVRADAVDPPQPKNAAGGAMGNNVVIKLGDADNGARRELRVGEEFEVALPENPTTGYRWQLHSPLGPALDVENNSFVGSSSGLIGAGGLRRWRFRALKAGVAVVTIDNRRSWEPAPVATFEVTIDVKAP